MYHTVSQGPAGLPLCTPVRPEPDMPYDMGLPIQPSPECRKLHDWAPCPCGYRPAGLVKGTWHFDDQCPRDMV